MLRWLGAALILSGGLLTRRSLLGETRHTQRTRRELAAAFEAMAAEIRLLLTPIPALLRRDRGENVSTFFEAVSRRLADEATLAEAWREASEALPLPAEERELIAALGERLSGDGESVCAALTLTAAALRRRYEHEESTRGERERLMTSICISASLFLTILLF